MREVFIRISLLITVLILCLFAGELITHIVQSSQTMFGKKLYVLHEYSAELGWRMKPNLDGIYERSEFKTHIKSNSNGFRGPLYDYDKKKDWKRIMILGDSFAEGYNVEYEELFSTLLQNSIGEVSKNFEILNCGVSGYSTDQELLFFKQEGYKYHPDLTFLVLCYNDVEGNSYNLAPGGFNKPFFEWSGDSLLLKNVPTPPKQNWGYKEEINHYETVLYNSRSGLFLRLKVWLSFNSKFYKLIADNETIHELIVKLGIGHDDFDELPVYASEYDEELWDLTEKLILLLKQELNKNGSQLVIVFVPTRVEYDRHFREKFLEKTKIDFKKHDIFNVNSFLTELCLNNDIDFIDPTSRFIEVSDSISPEKIYLMKDAHWNARGHKLVGELLYDYLEVNNYLE